MKETKQIKRVVLVVLLFLMSLGLCSSVIAEDLLPYEGTIGSGGNQRKLDISATNAGDGWTKWIYTITNVETSINEGKFLLQSFTVGLGTDYSADAFSFLDSKAGTSATALSTTLAANPSGSGKAITWTRPRPVPDSNPAWPVTPGYHCFSFSFLTKWAFSTSSWTDSTGLTYNIVDGTTYALGKDGEILAQSGNAVGPAASAVPEPGTILAALTLLAPAGVMFRRRKA